MYVCLCKGLTESRIRQAVTEGHDTLRALNAELGVGSQCAKCVRHARELIREVRSAEEVRADVVVQFWTATA